MKQTKQTITNFLNNEVNDYARYSVQHRAIPSLEDGLKPIHRYVIWSLKEEGLTYDKARSVSLSAIGLVMAYSPHGDSGVYDAIVSLSNDSRIYPLLDGKGSFGSITSSDSDIPPASARYTKTRLSEISTKEMLKDIKYDAVDMVDNYSEEKKEPVALPSTFPNILINPNDGIATGFRSYMPSYNVDDVINNVVKFIKGKKMDIMYPDFSTRGYVVEDKAEALKVKKTGKGKYKLRARYETTDNSILIKEVPYTTTKESIIDRIIKLKRESVLPEVVDVNDTTGKDGLEIEIKTHKSTDKDKLMLKLYAKTDLESNFNVNNVVLLGGQPKLYGTDSLVREWVRFRKATIVRIANSKIVEISGKLEILDALIGVLKDIDKTVELIKTSKNDTETLEKLMTEFELNETQATYVLGVKLKNLNKEYFVNKINEYDSLVERKDELQVLANSDEKLGEHIIEELENFSSKYGQERNTKIIKVNEASEYKEPKEEDLVEDYNVKVFITQDGYVKKVPLTSLRGGFKIKVKTGDELVNEIDTSNKSELLVFTDKHKVYKKRLYELEDEKPSTLGVYSPSELGLASDENVLYITVLAENNKWLLIGFENGKLAKVNLDVYRTKQNRKQIKKAYNDKSNPVFFKAIQEDIDLLVQSTDTKTILLNTAVVNAKETKTSQGNQFIKLKENNTAEFKVSNQDEDYEYYRVNSAGVGKKYKK